MIFIPHWHGEQDSIQLCSTSISSFLSPVIKKGCEWMVLALEMSGVVEDVLCQTQAKSEPEHVFTMYICWRYLFLPHHQIFLCGSFFFDTECCFVLKRTEPNWYRHQYKQKAGLCDFFVSVFSLFFLLLLVLFCLFDWLIGFLFACLCFGPTWCLSLRHLYTHTDTDRQIAVVHNEHRNSRLLCK